MALNLQSPIMSAGTRATSAAAVRMRRYETERRVVSVKNKPRHIEAARRVILSAEYHTDTAEVLAILLGMAGYEVKSICNVEGALEAAAGQVFDLYLIGDLLLHGGNVELTKQIRLFDSNTPLIVHSARAFASDISRGLSAGAQDYLVKPCDPDHLLSTIGRRINRSLAQCV